MSSMLGYRVLSSLQMTWKSPQRDPDVSTRLLDPEEATGRDVPCRYADMWEIAGHEYRTRYPNDLAGLPTGFDVPGILLLQRQHQWRDTEPIQVTVISATTEQRIRARLPPEHPLGRVRFDIARKFGIPDNHGNCDPPRECVPSWWRGLQPRATLMRELAPDPALKTALVGGIVLIGNLSLHQASRSRIICSRLLTILL
ncbi:hypothetical protein LMIY3S_00067 [Labrys miyagiensis]